VGDRLDVNGPFFQKWAEGIARFYVGTDTATIRISPTDMEAGIYHRKVVRSKWTRYEDAGSDGYPGNNGGFFASVIDTKQPGSQWTLSGKLHTIDRSSAGIPHLTTGLAYLFISRSDFSGFVFDDKEETNQMYAPMRDQVMGHFKIADLGSLESGHLLLSDASSASTSKGNVLRKKKSKGMTLDELNRHQEENRRKLNELALIDPNGRQPTVSDGNIGKVDSTNGVCVKTPMDGLFPISFHRDENNEIDLITIQMMENEKVISNVLAYGETNKGLRGAVSCVIPWEVNKKRDHEGWIHPMRRELEQKRSSGFGTNGPRHLVQAVFGGPVNFVYTHGVSSTGKEGWPRVEFLYYNCLEEHLNDVVNHYNWLAMRHRTGHAVRDTSGIQVGPADIWIARKLPTEQMNKLVLSTYTTACDDDVTVLLVMPISAFSMDMMTDILMAPRIYENMKEMNAGSHPMKPSHNAHNALDFCQYCGVRRGKKILKCSRCGNVAYCSKECQTKDWKTHKNACKKSKGEKKDE